MKREEIEKRYKLTVQESELEHLVSMLSNYTVIHIVITTDHGTVRINNNPELVEEHDEYFGEGTSDAEFYHSKIFTKRLVEMYRNQMIKIRRQYEGDETQA